jgi:nucleotidyltransferase/DNA polymerase involved in DNA repair
MGTIIAIDLKSFYASVELAFNNLSSDDQDFLVAVYENEEFINDLTNDLIE